MGRYTSVQTFGDQNTQLVVDAVANAGIFSFFSDPFLSFPLHLYNHMLASNTTDDGENESKTTTDGTTSTNEDKKRTRLEIDKPSNVSSTFLIENILFICTYSYLLHNPKLSYTYRQLEVVLGRVVLNSIYIEKPGEEKLNVGRVLKNKTGKREKHESIQKESKEIEKKQSLRHPRMLRKDKRRRRN